METNKFGDLMGLIGGFDFDATFELDGRFLEEKICKSVGKYDGSIEGICGRNITVNWSVVLLVASTTTGTSNWSGNEFDGKMNDCTVKSKVVKRSLAGKSKTSTSLHVDVVNVAFWF